MATIVQQQAGQPAQKEQVKKPRIGSRFKAWVTRANAKPDKQARGASDHEQQDTFYRRAIEWTHRADKVINLVLGYVLAVASVLGFMDVLSNGEVLGTVPYLFYLWLAVMGLGVDFQILLVIGRMPDLARTVENWFFRIIFFVFNLGFLGFLCYMSIIIAAVFTQHRDAAGTTIQASMSVLGIDSNRFVYERAALATLLLVLMAVDRTMERWRMQIDQADRNVQQPTTPVQNVPVVTAQPEEDKLEKLLNAMQTMNAQTLQAMHTQNQQVLQMTIEQITNITISTIEDRLASLPMAAQVPLLNAQNNAGTVTSVQEATGNTVGMEAVNVPGEPIGSSENAAANKRFGDAIQALITEHPELTGPEIAALVGCSERTAYKWLQRLQVQQQ